METVGTAGTAIFEDAPSTSSAPAAPRTLAQALAPVTTEYFLQQYLGKNYHYIPGHAGKFAALLQWSDLNSILRHHQLDVPQLRLARDGKQIPPESFISYHENRRNPAARLSRLRSAELTRQLQEGATLILDGVDELHEPVAELAEDLERALRARIQVNMYAGWRTSPGFDVHWDGHDVLILQLHGCKHWKVYPMTREYPLKGDPKDEKPPTEPVWEGMLNSGDLLYIPRGWWHVAVPVDAPTLHLTVGLHRVTGMDFVSWYADRLRSQSVIRKDLPILGTETEKNAYMKSLREAWEQAWEPGLLDDYSRYVDSQARSRPHFGLPEMAESSNLSSGVSMKWLVPRLIEVESDQGSVVVRGNGREWKFAAEARSVLEQLETSRTCTLEALEQSARGGLSPAKLRLFLQELIEEGFVSLVVNDAAQ